MLLHNKFQHEKKKDREMDKLHIKTQDRAFQQNHVAYVSKIARNLETQNTIFEVSAKAISP